MIYVYFFVSWSVLNHFSTLPDINPMTDFKAGLRIALAADEIWEKKMHIFFSASKWNDAHPGTFWHASWHCCQSRPFVLSIIVLSSDFAIQPLAMQSKIWGCKEMVIFLWSYSKILLINFVALRVRRVKYYLPLEKDMTQVMSARSKRNLIFGESFKSQLSCNWIELMDQY